MPSAFEDFEARQRETVRALRTLVNEARRPTASREAAATPGAVREAVAAELAGVTAAARSVEGPLGGTRQTESVERALTSTSRALRDVGAGLARNNRALLDTGALFRGGLQSLVGGLASGSGGGGLGGLLRSGFGLSPLVRGLVGLFRGGGREEPTEAQPFSLPPSLSLEAANTDRVLGGFPRVVRGQRDEVRTVQSNRREPPQVVVNVSAMDSQSFMDRSSDIAAAVRDAMLPMHPVNDVIGEV